MTDHIEEAKETLACGVYQYNQDTDIMVVSAFAQAHATIALAEQARIANIIAFCSLHEDNILWGNERVVEEIEKGLGL